jgi:sugar/nucleoside kinase (ribokinase family)
VKSKKFDVIVVGELNVDIILNRIESFPEIGKEKLAGDMEVVLGSSSAIFASNLSSLGAKVAFIGKIGNDNFGKLITDSLSRKGADVDLIIKDKNSNTGATIILNYDEDRAMITYQGAMNNLTIDDISSAGLGQAKHLHFSSYYLQPGIKKDVKTLFKSAKDTGLSTSFDMQWDPAEKWDLNYKEVLPYVDIFLPNEQELLFLTKESVLDNAIKKITPFVKHLVIKMGNKGSLLVTDGKNTFKESYLNNNVVDAIGAGDSFNAGFIFKYINDYKPSECQLFGNLMGAVNTTAAGGTAAFTSYKEIMKTAEEKFGYVN